MEERNRDRKCEKASHNISEYCQGTSEEGPWEVRQATPNLYLSKGSGNLISHEMNDQKVSRSNFIQSY